MNIDWVVAIGMFIAVVAWSFTFYADFFDFKTEPLSDVLNSISDKFVDYLTTDTYVVYANYTNTSKLGAGTFNFYMDMDFPEGTNFSTRVYKEGVLISAVSCEVRTNQVLFQAIVTPSNNTEFTIKFQNISGSSFCNPDTPLSRDIKLKPSAKEKMLMVSQTKINELNAMSYYDIQGNLSINRPFRVELEVNETVSNIFGLLPPNSTNVYVKEVWNKILDDDNRVLIRTMVW
ncbi:MAG: hypothetical protein ABIF08_01380 [Nanoarchaeota archaeon]